MMLHVVNDGGMVGIDSSGMERLISVVEFSDIPIQSAPVPGLLDLELFTIVSLFGLHFLSQDVPTHGDSSLSQIPQIHVLSAPSVG